MENKGRYGALLLWLLQQRVTCSLCETYFEFAEGVEVRNAAGEKLTELRDVEAAMDHLQLVCPICGKPNPAPRYTS